MRAVGYFRVSSLRQSGEDHFSLPAQRDLFMSRCHDRGYDPVGEYVDTESGRSASRKGYQTLLRDARAGMFDVIVVRAIDRFGRDADEITVRTSELRQAKVTIDAVNTVVNDSLPQNTQFLMRAVEAYIAQNTSELIASNVMGGMRKSAASGKYQGRPPYGYRSNGGLLVVNDEEAEVVRRIFTEYADRNIGPRTIARELNAEGIPSQQARGWLQQTLNNILRRETYAGALVWDEVRVEDSVPAIVSKELWERAQSRRRARARVPGGQTHTSDYLLSGILFCDCGARMAGRTSHMKKNEKVYHSRFYFCTRWDGGATLESNRHNAADLEERVIRDLSETIRDATIRIEQPHAPIVELAEVKKELASVDVRRARIVDAYSRNLYASDEQFQKDNRDLYEEEQSLRARIPALEQRIADADAARAELARRPERIQKLIDPSLTPQEKKAIIQAFVQRIEVKPGDPEPYIVS